MRAWWIRTRLGMLTVASGGGLFVLGGCDPNVREQVLTGVGTAATGLATTFIQAFFQNLINRAAEEHPTIVRAILEELPRFFA